MSASTVVGLVLGGLVATGVLWGLWLHADEDLRSPGLLVAEDWASWDTPRISLAGPDTSYNRSYTWTDRFDLAEPGDQWVIPQLPWHQRTEPPHVTGGTVFIEMTLNGQRVHANKFHNQAGATVEDWEMPRPDDLQGLSLKETNNTLEITATVTRPTANGTVVTALGPAFYEVVPAGDERGALSQGPMDTGSHAGGLAIPLAIVAGVGVARTTGDLMGWIGTSWGRRR